MRLLYICLSAAACLNVTACASLTAPSGPSQPPANLRQPCPDLNLPADGTGAAVLRWAIGTAEAYRECQSRHLRLVEAWPK